MRNYILLYTNDGVPEPHAGCARCFIIRIRPSHKDDRGLLEHEKVHVDQWWKFWERKPKLEREVEAYREQLKWSPGREALFAMFIATRYGLDITATEAERRLRA